MNISLTSSFDHCTHGGQRTGGDTPSMIALGCLDEGDERGEG